MPSMTLTYHIFGNTGAPIKANIYRLGQGCWRLNGGEEAVLRYSTDGKYWTSLDAACGPISLYNCQLYVDTQSQGQVNQVPLEIVPRGSRVREKVNPNPNDELKNLPIMNSEDYYKEIKL